LWRDYEHIWHYRLKSNGEDAVHRENRDGPAAPMRFPLSYMIPTCLSGSRLSRAKEAIMASGGKIQSPAGFVPQQAVSFGTAGGEAVAVDAAHPLPITPVQAQAASVSLAGSTAASGGFGPFAPDPARAIWVTLAGSWTGTVRLLRSIDGGATRLPLTYGDGSPKARFTANVQAPVAEESVAAARYWLDVQLTGGTLAYRVEQ
jgi:hypothetical protein